MTMRIGQVIMLLHGGDREEARSRFATLWKEIGEDGSPVHRCTLAHYMADTQDDPEDELAWDLKALRAADAVDQNEVAWGDHVLSVRGFYPSLYLNLAADYHKLGEHGIARGYLGRARESSDALADDAYGDGIRAALDRLELRLATAADPDQLP
ncbi:hypothetical protein [Streptantibioticus ferralitis]|uniref:Tetratricopeptide repeat protein n=1 Tax=Streptantibioticus ferralitis TaxID=236510 RepID=A0ABT5Z8K1_9ACTN|nr:hypothetical protein [Streptantibioticus ferralitis]MDF2260156.1 hypothetical protein [Streptantibioticus ferralitis]